MNSRTITINGVPYHIECYHHTPGGVVQLNKAEGRSVAKHYDDDWNEITARPENPRKRKNLRRWQEARLRRLRYEESRGSAAIHQIERIKQLEKAIGIGPEGGL